MVNYYHLALRGKREQEVRNLKKQLEELNISKPTDDEIFELLLKKNEKFILTPTEVRKIISNKRGVQI